MNSCRTVKKIYITVICVLLLTAAPRLVAIFDWDRGAAAAAVENWDKAAGHYANAVSSDPDNPELLYDYGVASFHTGAIDQAEVCFESAAHSDRADVSLKEHAYFNLGNVKVQKEQFSEAVTAYEDALRINPENERAKHNRDLAKQKEEEEKEQEEQQSQENSEQNDSENQSDNSDDSQGDNQSQDQSDDDNQESSDQQNQDNDGESSDQGDSPQDQEQQENDDDSSSQQDRSNDEQQDNNTSEQDEQKQSQNQQNKEQQKDSPKDDQQQQDKGQEEEQSTGSDQEQNGGGSDSGSPDGEMPEDEQEDDPLNTGLEGVSPWIADMLEQQEAHESELSKEKMKSAINAGQAGSNEKNAW